MGKPPPPRASAGRGQGHRGTKDALSSPVASVMPAGAAAPWRRPGVAWQGAAGRYASGGRARAACGSRPGADGRPASAPVSFWIQGVSSGVN